MKEWTLTDLPLYVATSRSKWWLNLNVLGRTHGKSIRANKKKYGKVVAALLETQNPGKLPTGTAFVFEYTYWNWRNARVDVENPCSVISKFVNDSLVEAGIIEDDDYTRVPVIVHRYGGVDRERPRVDLRVVPVSQYRF